MRGSVAFLLSLPALLSREGEVEDLVIAETRRDDAVDNIRVGRRSRCVAVDLEVVERVNETLLKRHFRQKTGGVRRGDLVPLGADEDRVIGGAD